MFASRTGWLLAPNRFSAALERIRASGREVLDLTESNPTRCEFTYAPETLTLLTDASSIGYHPHPKGLRAAREAVCAYYAQRGTKVGPEHLILTASTSEGYSFVFRLLCDPGDEVLVPIPSYPLFEFVASIQDVKLSSYPLLYDHGWQIDFHSLSGAITPRTRAVLVVHPNNPTGSFVKQDEMAELEALCGRRGIALVADEVFLDYTHDGVNRRSFSSVSEALTFVLSGISKICALPQMKLAWILASGPSDLRDQALTRLEVIADTYLSVSTPVQSALPGFLARHDGIQRQIKKRVAGNVVELDRQLRSHKSVRRLEIEGGWYAVLRVPVTRSDEELSIALLEQQSVVTHPGHFFDFPDEGHLVVSLITPQDIFAEGTRRVVGSF